MHSHSHTLVFTAVVLIDRLTSNRTNPFNSFSKHLDSPLRGPPLSSCSTFTAIAKKDDPLSSNALTRPRDYELQEVRDSITVCVE
ncbi:unnamed protein product [Hydatigera taeniaeformis]|uniref:Secreted protein n=1 Tax=Hydatigena taeniaeformis TaxID=6205 RepID=A0A0R3WMU6_HYDTA|nr:unnamed protein product [Hydatigera taeniaeformis]